MSSVTIVLDNSLNSPENNPPGCKIWVGGAEVHDPSGILVDKTDTFVSYTFDSSVTSLNTWYYGGYSWYSGVQLNGPFTSGDKIIIKKVNL